ncbi:MAG: GNAT family N-acetyltransferase [Lewinellaceae bacterium]|nr:GNAT family N-acetyltransferase [Lewinellaceae bacterium]
MNFQCLPFEQLSLGQLYKIMKLRQEVFVVEQNCPYLDADDKDQESFHLVSWDENGEALAYVRLLPKGLSYPEYASIGRVVTSAKIRRSGGGKQLMQEALLWAKKLFGDTPVKISAQSYLLSFYRNLGFEPIGEEYLEDDIPHRAMILRD